MVVSIERTLKRRRRRITAHDLSVFVKSEASRELRPHDFRCVNHCTALSAVKQKQLTTAFHMSFQCTSAPIRDPARRRIH